MEEEDVDESTLAEQMYLVLRSFRLNLSECVLLVTSERVGLVLQDGRAKRRTNYMTSLGKAPHNILAAVSDSCFSLVIIRISCNWIIMVGRPL